ncbi:MAG: hypothetical protein ACNYNY_00775 [Candidatus Oxydemutatoraceae bacterium WSBS_2016_MAG_OTU14]
MTNPLPLSNPTMVTAAVEVRRQDTATVSDIRVAWSSVANAQSYTVKTCRSRQCKRHLGTFYKDSVGNCHNDCV